MYICFGGGGGQKERRGVGTEGGPAYKAEEGRPPRGQSHAAILRRGRGVEFQMYIKNHSIICGHTVTYVSERMLNRESGHLQVYSSIAGG